METLVRTALPDTEFFSSENSDPANYSTELTDIVMDSYNEQVQLGETFRKDMQNMIDRMEFAYPNDPKKLKDMINRYVEFSQRSLVAYMKKTLDLHVQHGGFVTVTVKKDPPHNREWMKDLVEQLLFLKGDAEAIFQAADEEEEEYCHYEILN
ncbi:MAG: hypothetical protein ACXVPQ_11190 [Bacteroidia bacterium]